MKRLLYFPFAFLFIMSCGEPKSPIKKHVHIFKERCFVKDKLQRREIISRSALHQGKMITYAVFLQGSGKYSLKIVTTFRFDTAFNEEYPIMADWNRVIKTQKIDFLFDDSIIKEIPFVKEYGCVIRKKSELENDLDFIASVYFADNLNGTSGCYEIDGFGGSNGGSEYFGYYSMKGELLCDWYHDYPHSESIKKRGEWKNVISTLCNGDSTRFPLEINGIYVTPLEWANEPSQEKIWFRMFGM
jgi:hypothetical protein